LGWLVNSLALLLRAALLPRAQVEGGFLTGLGFQGWHWLLPLVIVPLAAAVAYAATRAAAQITLRNMP